MIRLPKPPKQPKAKSSLRIWKEYIRRLSEWVHVLEQVENYSAHKFAVKHMDLKEHGPDGTRTPKFKVKRRNK
jgi:hypothetical protein